MKNLNADIKSMSFKRVYLLYGNDEFLKKSYMDRLIKAVSGDDTMNTKISDGKNPDPVEIKDFLETMPFFADYRLVVLRDTSLFETSSSDAWTGVVSSVPESAVLIFVETKVDKRNKLYKAVNQAGYTCEINTPGQDELMRWTAQLLKRENKLITQSACEALVMRAGDSCDNLKTQLDKLVCYVGEKGEIDLEDVDAVCTEQPTSQVFRMLDAATEGKTAAALSLYYDMLALREPSMRIMYLLGRQCNNLLMIREMSAAGMSQSQIASKLKLPGFAVNKTIRQSRAFSKDKLKEFVKMSVELEELVKTGRLDEKIAVETAIIKMCKR